MIGISYINLGKYIVAYNQTPENRKTKIFDLCNSKNELIYLGQIKYNPRWRKYCFYPVEDTVFDGGCLHEIISFLDKLNLERIRNEFDKEGKQ